MLAWPRLWRSAISCASAVVFDHHWVINGNVGGALIELAYGIAAYLHDFIHQVGPRGKLRL